MRNILCISMLSLVFCNFGAMANFDKETDKIVKQYIARTKQAEQEHQRGATPITISNLSRAYAATEAASKIAGAKSVKQAYAIVQAYATEASAAEQIHQKKPTAATIARLNKAYGATEAAHKVFYIIEQATRAVPPPVVIQVPVYRRNF